MKYYVTTLIVITAFSAAAESAFQGTALYQKSVNIHASLPADQAALKAFVPEFKHIEVKVSLYDHLLRVQESNTSNEGGGAKVMVSAASATGGETNTLLNTKEKSVTAFGKVMDIDFIYSKKIPVNEQIKFLEETQLINGYLCKKAIDESNDLIIWYTNETPGYVVPSVEFLTMPGSVIKAEGEKISYELLSLNEQAIDKSLVETPQGHKEISYEQYKDLQEEAMEEMMDKMGVKGSVIRSGS